MALLFFLISISSVSALTYDQDERLLNDIKEFKEARKSSADYRPDWMSLDSRPLPQWYDQAKIGILIHWGVYSVPAFQSEWFWKTWMDTPQQAYDDKFLIFVANEFVNKDIKYTDMADMLTAENFDPEDIALTLRKSGAKYVILSAKHFDGFSMFHSMQAPGWNCKDRGPQRDVMKELALSVKKQNMAFGVQYSLSEWYNLWYLNDKEGFFNNSVFPSYRVFPELKDIVIKYAPSVIRAHGDSEASMSYWKPRRFLTWLYNKSPVRTTVVVNDRWGYDSHFKHGDYYSYVNESCPKTLNRHKWEIVLSMDHKSWGYRRDMHVKDVISLKKIARTIVNAVSRGGNVLLNIGLTKSGKIPKMFKKQLGYLGEWLDRNGEAIYGTSPWIHSTDPYNKDARYTCLRKYYNGKFPTDRPETMDHILAIYALFTKWPRSNKMILEGIAPVFRNDTFVAVLIGQSDWLEWTWIKGKIVIELPTKFNSTKLAYNIGWALKFSRVYGERVVGRVIDVKHDHDWAVDMSVHANPLAKPSRPDTYSHDNFVRLPRD